MQKPEFPFMRCLVCFCLMGISFSCLSQVEEYRELLESFESEVSVSKGDTTIEARLYKGDVKPEVKLDKNYHWYRSFDIHATQGGYSGKLLHGKYQQYYPNGNLHRAGYFCKGLKICTWREWHPNGKMKQTVNWEAGQKQGKFMVYNENGNPVKKGHYEEGKLDGDIYFYEEGAVDTVKTYDEGVLEKDQGGSGIGGFFSNLFRSIGNWFSGKSEADNKNPKDQED